MQFIAANNLGRHELLQEVEGRHTQSGREGEICHFQEFADYTFSEGVMTLPESLDDRILTACLQGKQLGYQFFIGGDKSNGLLTTTNNNRTCIGRGSPFTMRGFRGLSWLLISLYLQDGVFQ